MERVLHKNRGARQNLRHRSIPKFSSDSSSYTSASAVEALIACKVERRSLKMVAGTPIKKLLAEEMWKDIESKQRQPGLIAKLMGLDHHDHGMPHQRLHLIQRKDKHYIETCKQRSTSFDLDMQNKHRLRRLNRKGTSLGEHEFRDVYEIPETIKFEKPRRGKRFSSSNEFFETMDELNSNKEDVFTKCHQQPDSLLHKHLDVKDATTPTTQSCCIAILKPSKSTICESNNIGWKSDKEGLSRMEPLHVTKTLPTRIVVLKPNLDQMKSTSISVSPSDSFSKSRSEDSKEIAKEITRRMRKCFRKDPVELASSLIGYAGDDSSYSVYESDSASESEVTILTSRQSFHLSNRRNPVDSFVNREAKRRLTDRWKMSQRRKAMEILGKGNSLGEMLSIPDSTNASHAISSMDGWMGLHTQNSTERGGTSRNGSKQMKERYHKGDGSSMRNTKKLHRSQHMRNSSSDSSERDCLYQPQMVVDKEEIKLFEDEFPPKKTSAELEISSTSPCHMQTSKATKVPEEEKLREDSVPLPCPVTEPQSPGGSLKEADHTSPVSVLETPFTEEPVSVPNCFEIVSAGLLELKMQLKLLKMESGSCPEGNYDQAFEEYEDNLVSSYLTDILIDSCIQNWNLDSLISTWYSPECPINYGLFENLEKKYCDDTRWGKEERKFLFDRISVCIFEMFEPYTDSYPWLKLLGIRKVADSNMNISELKYKVEEELENEEKSVEKEIMERMVNREMEWTDFREYMDVIGRELEMLLLNELIEEVAFMGICKR